MNNINLYIVHDSNIVAFLGELTRPNKKNPNTYFPAFATIMDRSQIPPPPYSETDPDAPSSVILTPTTSNADSSPWSDPALHDLGGDSLGASPYTAAYFASRPVSSVHDGPPTTHNIHITAETKPKDLPYPEPPKLFLPKDLTEQDWETFVR